MLVVPCQLITDIASEKEKDSWRDQTRNLLSQYTEPFLYVTPLSDQIWYYIIICYFHSFYQALSVRQIYRICTMYWDDKYGAQSVSTEARLVSIFNFEILSIHY